MGSLLLKQWSWTKKIRAAMGATIMVLAVLIVVEVLGLRTPSPPPMSSVGLPASGGLRDQGAKAKQLLSAVEGRRLFEPAIPLASRRVAKESVDRIKSLLTLNGVMMRNGQAVAYLQIANVGMKAMRVGDSYEDLFTVTRIGRNAVELEIVGERIELEM